MIIGVDAGALSIHDERLKVGVFQITLHLLEELAAIDHTNEYRLYSFSPLAQGILRRFGPSMRNVVLKPTRGWMTIRLPLELHMHPVDIFLGLSQALPVIDCYKVGFIYDIAFLHLPEAYPGSSKRLRRQTEQLVKRADTIITISESSKRDIYEHFRDKLLDIRVCYLGVESRFNPKGDIYVGKNPYFLFVGALKPGKNIPTVLYAFSQFLNKTKRVHDFICIGGDYWLDQEIPRTIKDLGLKERVHFLGAIPHERLPPYYRGAFAFVSPSLWEGFCLPAVEAMACGCPVIGSTRGAFPEIVGNAGILVDPHDEKSLLDAMLRVVSDRKQRERMIEQGIGQAKRFSWQDFAMNVYRLIRRRKSYRS